MTEKIKSLDQDFIFGEMDECAMLRAEIERLRAALNGLYEAYQDGVPIENEDSIAVAHARNALGLDQPSQTIG